MKKQFSIRRDTLDYMLTDSTPVETSELFTYNYMYEYLHANRAKLDSILEEIESKEKNQFTGHIVPFQSGWNTMPLDYKITKNNGSYRKMCIPQPLSVVNIYYFINMYQKDILNQLSKSKYSIRYPVRNSDLFYKEKGKKLIDYQYKRKKSEKKEVEQSGKYFDLKPYRTILDFELGEEWRLLNLKYKYLTKLDYKRCFDSIYTHSYKWTVTKDVIDSRSFRNSSLFAVIDRLLQNINGSVSNGIIVGPEFSRMIVEILLQKIDEEVFNNLQESNIKFKKDYEIKRFVDDIYVFCNTIEERETILKCIEKKSAKYLLEINDLKTEKHETPYLRSSWIKEVEDFRDKLLYIFRNSKMIKDSEEDFQVKCDAKQINELKETFENLIAKYKDNTQSILHYILSVIYNSVSCKPVDYRIFKKPDHNSVSYVLDLLLYIYSQSVSFTNTQKLISLLYYFDAECDFKATKLLGNKFRKYEEYISNTYYSEYINLLVIFNELNITFNSSIEQRLYDQIAEADDPIALATYLYYAKYNNTFLSAISVRVDHKIKEKLDIIIKDKEEHFYREFWYLLIFNKCPYIKKVTQDKCNDILLKLSTRPTVNAALKTNSLILDFLLDSDQECSFISWNTTGKRMLKEITYRTAQRTVFRNRAGGLDTSL